jgi:site-specific DNA recombinase
MNTKLILIARVSDEDQRKALPAQKLRLENYAAQKEMEYEYYEFDESAHEEDREKFAQIVAQIEAETEDCLVAFDKIDRLTRDSSQKEVAILTKLVKQGKIELHFPNDALYINQHSSAAEWFHFSMGMSLAKYYSDSISDNVKRRFEQMLKNGYWVHRAPIGYLGVRIDDDNFDIVIDEERAPFIVRAFELRATGLPYEVIATQLKAEGFTTRAGKAPGKSHIEQIINRRFYYGVMIHNGKEYNHRYPTLIERSLFNKCQSVKEERKHEMTKYNSGSFTFKRLVKCGRCKRAVSAYYGRKQVYLRCSGTGVNNCGNPNTAEALILGGVESDIANVRMTERFVEQVIDELRKRHDNQQLYYSTTVEQTRRKYDSLKNKLNVSYEDRLDGRITPQRFDELANRIEREQQDLNDKLKSLTKDNKSFQVTASYLLDLAQRANELFKCSNHDLRQELLSYMLSNVELNDKSLSYILSDPFKEIVESKKNAQHEPESKIWQGHVESNHDLGFWRPLY